jgi:hypothetical protein
MSAPRILPTKRHAAPMKGSKPRLIIRGGAMSDLPKLPVPLPKPTMTSTPPENPNKLLPPILTAEATAKAPTVAAPPTSVTNPAAQTSLTPASVGSAGAPTGATTAAAPVPSQRQTGGATTKKRRFTERRLSIAVKQDKSTRRQRKHMKRKMAKMSVEEIRKILIEKKIIKPKANPPEEMMRSMMRDLLSV